MRQQVGCHEGSVGVATHSYLACVSNPTPLQLLTNKGHWCEQCMVIHQAGSVHCDIAASKTDSGQCTGSNGSVQATWQGQPSMW